MNISKRLYSSGVVDFWSSRPSLAPRRQPGAMALTRASSFCGADYRTSYVADVSSAHRRCGIVALLAKANRSPAQTTMNATTARIATVPNSKTSMRPPLAHTMVTSVARRGGVASEMTAAPRRGLMVTRHGQPRRGGPPLSFLLREVVYWQ